MRKTWWAGTLGLTLALGAGPAAFGAAFTPGNILVSGSNNVLYEYTTAGVKVQSWNVPFPVSRNGTEMTRDVTVGPDGKAYIFNGTFTPYLTVLDPVSGNFSHYQGVGFSEANVLTYGGVATNGRYVFMSDMNTNGSGSVGIVRFDLLNGFASQRFQASKEYNTLTMGRDGYLYALNVSANLGWPNLDVFDPDTMTRVRTVNFTTGIKAAAIDADGTIYTVGGTNGYSKFSSTGVLEQFFSTGNSYYDINITDGGQLVASRSGVINITSTDLTGYTYFSEPGGASFVSFVPTPVPLPTAAALAGAGLGIVGLLIRRRR